jgi:hypothetical protein
VDVSCPLPHYTVSPGGQLLEGGDFFKNGRIDPLALTAFIKNVKMNTNLSDEDAAILAASKVTGNIHFHINIHISPQNYHDH